MSLAFQLLLTFLAVAGGCWIIARWTPWPTVRAVLLVIVVILGTWVLLSLVGVLPPLASLR